MSKNVQLHIEGMTCTSCAAAVEKALSKVPQVEIAQVNFAGKKALLQIRDGDEVSGAAIGASVRGSEGNLQEQLRKAVRDAGYAVVDPEEKRAQADAHIRVERRRLVWSWVGTVPLMILMALHMFWEIHLLPEPLRQVVPLVLSATVIYGIGYPIIRSTLQSFRNLAFTMDSLIGIGATAAFSTGLLRLFGVDIGDFTSVGAMIVAINYIGTYIKVKATGRASSAIQQLLELGAKEATSIGPDGSETVVDVATLGIGDIVRVRPGEKVPADGTIIRGSTSIDESIVTGESVPADKSEGDTVVGATINQMGVIDVRIEKTGDESFLAQIVMLVEDAQSSRVPVQELADRVTAVFVPVILVLSAATFGGWMLFPAETSITAALSAAIATLVIACPCALGLATPTALMVGMGFGAEHGVLIRNGEAIQTARKLSTVVFDKTGTLTIGRPEVRNSCGPLGAPVSEDAAAMTLAIERESEHPLARSLATYLLETANNRPVAGPARWTAGSTRAVPGHGIIAELYPFGSEGTDKPSDPVKVRVGSVRWLRSEGATLDTEQRRRTEQWKGEGMTVVGTAAGETVVALYALSDTIQGGAAEAISQLHNLGLRTAMLTGDSEAAARAIAADAGIDDVFAELLPEQKIDAVRKLQGSGHTVAMVGDGINDAPALKQANVGIAIGTGTDIAIESADITLMSSNLEMIPRAVEISRRTFRKIKTNLFWAFFYNIIAIPLAVSGLLHPVIAEVAMAFSSITVVGNSLHLKRILGRTVGSARQKQTIFQEEPMGLFGSDKKVTYHVADMNCSHCEAKVTAALKELGSVKKVKADAKSKRVVIEYGGDSEPDIDLVNSVLEPAGYPATAL